MHQPGRGSVGLDGGGGSGRIVRITKAYFGVNGLKYSHGDQ